MLKSLVLCLLLWHEMCEFSGHATQSLNNTYIPKSPAIVLSKNNYTDIQNGSKVNSTVHTTHTTNSPLLGKSDLGGKLSSIKNVSRPDYLVTNGIGAHKLHVEEKDWWGAREVCKNEGGDLVVIRSLDEETIVLQMMGKIGVDEVWIGLHDQLRVGDWISVLGEPLGETGWYKEVVWNPSANFYRCAKLSTKPQRRESWVVSRLKSDGCYFIRQFVCKISTS